MPSPSKMAAGSTARPVLRRLQTVIEPALREAVDTLPGMLRLVAGYHFGWWDQHGQAREGPAGKALRPALVLLAAEAVAGEHRQAVPAAAAVELVHNFSLIHDDLMDGDTTRRHRPTVWHAFGVSEAVLVGDALLNLAQEVVAQIGELAAAEMLTAAVGDLIEGQAEDIGFESQHEVSVEQCVQMARLKTAALLECSTALGALAGGGSPDQIARLRRYGADLGLAFQHTDDLLGIWGDPAVTGKPVYSDLRSRKKTLPVVAAWHATGPAAVELVATYRRRGELSEQELRRLAGLVAAAGGRQWSMTEAARLTEQATGALADDASLGRTQELAALADLVTYRDR